jgi:hypothetical protein
MLAVGIAEKKGASLRAFFSPAQAIEAPLTLWCRNGYLRFPRGQFAIGFALQANGDGFFAIGAKLTFDRFFHG